MKIRTTLITAISFCISIARADEAIFATVGFLHQLPIGEAFSQDNKEFATHDGYLFGDEHEKYYVRVRIGFNF
jgi:hypothetical protein